MPPASPGFFRRLVVFAGCVSGLNAGPNSGWLKPREVSLRLNTPRRHNDEGTIAFGRLGPIATIHIFNTVTTIEEASLIASGY